MDKLQEIFAGLSKKAVWRFMQPEYLDGYDDEDEDDEDDDTE